jgi:8-oxo-dGTP pyrophosphatase MutT (NUDIX family)
LAAVSSPRPEDALPPVLTHREVYRGRLLRLEVDEVRESNGAVGLREVVRHPGSVAVLAVHDDGRLVLVRQYRHPVRRRLWELPAGLLNPDEAPVDGARRELEEETGLSPAKMEEVADYITTPGFCDERIWVYRATALRPVPARPDEDEDIESAAYSLAEAQEMVRRGEIRDGKTVMALLLESQRLRGTAP